jgi:tight adherence protein C
LPVLGYLLGAVMTETWLMHGLLVAPTLFLGVFGPNWVLRFLRGPYLRILRKGLPDALDLMVVCGVAGLGLESAVNRVAREMERSAQRSRESSRSSARNCACYRIAGRH